MKGVGDFDMPNIGMRMRRLCTQQLIFQELRLRMARSRFYEHVNDNACIEYRDAHYQSF
jgi:hypothetical protein